MKIKEKTLTIAVVVGFSSLAFYLSSISPPRNQGEVVKVSVQEKQEEKVFQVLADEGHPDKTGRIIWIRNTETGECHLITKLGSGTALVPALCEKNMKKDDVR